MGLITTEVEAINTGAMKNRLLELGFKNLELHEKVMINISTLSKGSQYKIKYKCDYCGKEEEATYASLYRTLNSNNSKLACKDCKYKYKIADILEGNYKISLYDWCIQNNRQDLLNRWDYELNKCDPHNISNVSHDWYYLKCENNLHDSEKHKPLTLTIDNKTKLTGGCRKCNSIAQWGINNICDDFLEKYWDYDKNINMNPWEIAKSSKSDIWIRCNKDTTHPSYKTKVYNLINGNRCPYCYSRKIIPQNSFAQYLIDTYGKDILEKCWDYQKNVLNPWEIAKSANIKVWIICQEKDYHGSYLMTTNKIHTRGLCCSYCAKRKIHPLDSLGTLYPEVIPIWSDKNEKSPFEYAPKSNQKVWWKCPDGKHEDYLRNISDSATYEFRCSECTRERDESYLQEKVRTYITEKYEYNLNHEHKCTIVPCNPKYNGNQGAMPFDNEVIDLKLIIEVNGEQHYNTKAYSGTWAKKDISPEEQLHKRKLYDRYKRFIAYCNGYFYLEIPYWTEKDEGYKSLIDKKIQAILTKIKEE